MSKVPHGGRDGPANRRRILRFVRAFTDREGYPPTTREIGEAVGLALFDPGLLDALIAAVISACTHRILSPNPRLSMNADHVPHR